MAGRARVVCFAACLATCLAAGLGAGFVLVPAVASAQPVQVQAVPSVPAAEPDQAELARLQAQNARLAADLKTAQDRLAQREEQEARLPGWLRRLPPVVQAWLPVAAAALSLLALGLALLLLEKGRRLRREHDEAYGVARGKVQQVEEEFAVWLAARRAEERAAPEPASASATERVLRPRRPSAAGKKRVAAPADKPAEPPASVVDRPLAPNLSAPMAEDAARDSLEQPRAPTEPQTTTDAAPQMNGDPVADYALARAMPEAGAERLRAQYGSLSGLSCTNLEQARRADGGALRFAPSQRPMFLAFPFRGAFVVVPALDRDLQAARASFEGVFTYPAEAAGALQLDRVAVVRAAGEEWLLEQPGAMRLG